MSAPSNVDKERIIALCRKGGLSGVRSLVNNAGWTDEDVAHEGYTGRPCIAEAAAGGWVDMVEYLLDVEERGFLANVLQGQHHANALVLAVQEGHVDVLQVILQHLLKQHHRYQQESSEHSSLTLLGEPTMKYVMRHATVISRVLPEKKLARVAELLAAFDRHWMALSSDQSKQAPAAGQDRQGALKPINTQGKQAVSESKLGVETVLSQGTLCAASSTAGHRYPQHADTTDSSRPGSCSTDQGLVRTTNASDQEYKSETHRQASCVEPGSTATAYRMRPGHRCRSKPEQKLPDNSLALFLEISDRWHAVLRSVRCAALLSHCGANLHTRNSKALDTLLTATVHCGDAQASSKPTALSKPTPLLVGRNGAARKAPGNRSYRYIPHPPLITGQDCMTPLRLRVKLCRLLRYAACFHDLLGALQDPAHASTLAWTPWWPESSLRQQARRMLAQVRVTPELLRCILGTQSDTQSLGTQSNTQSVGTLCGEQAQGKPTGRTGQGMKGAPHDQSDDRTWKTYAQHGLPFILLVWRMALHKCIHVVGCLLLSVSPSSKTRPDTSPQHRAGTHSTNHGSDSLLSTSSDRSTTPSALLPCVLRHAAHPSDPAGYAVALLGAPQSLHRSGANQPQDDTGAVCAVPFASGVLHAFCAECCGMLESARHSNQGTGGTRCLQLLATALQVWMQTMVRRKPVHCAMCPVRRGFTAPSHDRTQGPHASFPDYARGLKQGRDPPEDSEGSVSSTPLALNHSLQQLRVEDTVEEAPPAYEAFLPQEEQNTTAQPANTLLSASHRPLRHSSGDIQPSVEPVVGTIRVVAQPSLDDTPVAMPVAFPVAFLEPPHPILGRPQQRELSSSAPPVALHVPLTSPQGVTLHFDPVPAGSTVPAAAAVRAGGWFSVARVVPVAPMETTEGCEVAGAMLCAATPATHTQYSPIRPTNSDRKTQYSQVSPQLSQAHPLSGPSGQPKQQLLLSNPTHVFVFGFHGDRQRRRVTSGYGRTRQTAQRVPLRVCWRCVLIGSEAACEPPPNFHEHSDQKQTDPQTPADPRHSTVMAQSHLFQMLCPHGHLAGAVETGPGLWQDATSNESAVDAGIRSQEPDGHHQGTQGMAQANNSTKGTFSHTKHVQQKSKQLTTSDHTSGAAGGSATRLFQNARHFHKWFYRNYSHRCALGTKCPKMWRCDAVCSISQQEETPARTVLSETQPSAPSSNRGVPERSAPVPAPRSLKAQSGRGPAASLDLYAAHSSVLVAAWLTCVRACGDSRNDAGAVEQTQSSTLTHPSDDSVDPLEPLAWRSLCTPVLDSHRTAAAQLRTVCLRLVPAQLRGQAIPERLASLLRFLRLTRRCERSSWEERDYQRAERWWQMARQQMVNWRSASARLSGRAGCIQVPLSMEGPAVNRDTPTEECCIRPTARVSDQCASVQPPGDPSAWSELVDWLTYMHNLRTAGRLHTSQPTTTLQSAQVLPSLPFQQPSIANHPSNRLSDMEMARNDAERIVRGLLVQPVTVAADQLSQQCAQRRWYGLAHAFSTLQTALQRIQLRALKQANAVRRADHTADHEVRHPEVKSGSELPLTVQGATQDEPDADPLEQAMQSLMGISEMMQSAGTSKSDASLQ